PGDMQTAGRVKEDIEQASPQTDVMLREVDIADPWDFEQVYTALLDFATHYPFDTENEEYLVHITTGTHVVQICWFLLTEASYLPARLIQTAPRHDIRDNDPAGVYTIIDLDLSRYTQITGRFQKEQQAQVAFLKSGI
ncbi:sigma 54-dependent transcriptional regulator, partial [Salmonella enterica subsp. enterica serovar Offa]|nr:sigma 54-dependent transcriptional regulator [Salmonella enterica subsp. enterica serovar Offa]